MLVGLVIAIRTSIEGPGCWASPTLAAWVHECQNGFRFSSWKLSRIQNWMAGDMQWYWDGVLRHIFRSKGRNGFAMFYLMCLPDGWDIICTLDWPVNSNSAVGKDYGRRRWQQNWMAESAQRFWNGKLRHYFLWQKCPIGSSCDQGFRSKNKIGFAMFYLIHLPVGRGMICTLDWLAAASSAHGHDHGCKLRQQKWMAGVQWYCNGMQRHCFPLSLEKGPIGSSCDQGFRSKNKIGFAMFYLLHLPVGRGMICYNLPIYIYIYILLANTHSHDIHELS